MSSSPQYFVSANSRGVLHRAIVHRPTDRHANPVLCKPHDTCNALSDASVLSVRLGITQRYMMQIRDRSQNPVQQSIHRKKQNNESNDQQSKPFRTESVSQDFKSPVFTYCAQNNLERPKLETILNNGVYQSTVCWLHFTFVATAGSHRACTQMVWEWCKDLIEDGTVTNFQFDCPIDP